MARTKTIVRIIPQVVLSPRIGKKNIPYKRHRNMIFKIKQMLPQSKRVAVKKGQVIRNANARRKAIYFSGKRRLNFV